MPTEAELEELVTEHIEKAVEGIEEMVRLQTYKQKGRESVHREMPVSELSEKME